MDHYFNSIAKHLTDGSGNNQGNGGNPMNSMNGGGNNFMGGPSPGPGQGNMGMNGPGGGMMNHQQQQQQQQQQHHDNRPMQQMQPQMNMQGSGQGSQNNMNMTHDMLQQQMSNANSSRQSFGSQMGNMGRSSSASINNPYNSKALLEMLDSDLNEGNNNINGNNMNGQQSQMMMAAAMLNQQRQNMGQNQFQQQMQGGQGGMQMGGGGHGQMQGGQGGIQGGGQGGGGQQHGQGQNQGQMMQQQQQQMNSQQKQIQEFLNSQGHNLTPQQRASLQQQLINMQQQNNNPGMNVMNMGQGGGDMNMSQGGGDMNVGQGGGGQSGPGSGQSAQGGGMNMSGNNMSNNQSNAQGGSPTSGGGGGGGGGGNQSVRSMDDLMLRQREQLRHLQVMLKTQHNQDDQGQGGQGQGQGQDNMRASGAMSQSPHSGLSPGPNQQHQQMQQRGSMNMQQQMPQQQHHSNMQMNQQQQQQMQQQQKIQQMSQHSSAVMQQMIQQRQMQANASQQQQQQMHAPQSQMPTQQANLQQPQHQSQRQGMMRRPGASSQQESLNNSISPQPVVQSVDQPESSMQPAPNMSSGGGQGVTTRVVPVSVSPHLFSSVQGGGVSEASLIYTKHALDSIIKSLNAPLVKNESTDGKEKSPSQGRVYSIRDLSTCLGAWDLNIPTTSCQNKRAKIEEPSSTDFNDGNADTAFNFYHERSCPILLDAKRSTGIFSVEDFSEDSTATGLPVVVGAVVLTFGADCKFTGGIGEEGVLTKAIFEFFYDPIVALGEDGEKNAGEEALIEAEERIFVRIDGESSTLIKAALHALSPPAVTSEESASGKAATSSSSDDGIYTPTIWSGNTNRIYQYCLLGNFDDEGKERVSKRLCVAIKKTKTDEAGEKGPAKGVCRVTLTLSPASVLAKKKQMAVEKEESGGYHSDALASTASAVHKKIRLNLRTLRPPKLTTLSNRRQSAILAHAERSRRRLRRSSISKLIDPSLIIVGIRCKHELLLDAEEVGKVYINGVLVVDCSLPPIEKKKVNLLSSDRVIGTLGPDILPSHTLFGVDFTLDGADKGLLSSKLPSRTVLEREYGALLVDALIDAEQSDADFAGKLMNRLNFGKIEEDFDDFDEDGKDGPNKSETHSRNASSSSFNDTFDDHGDHGDGSSRIIFDDTSRHSLESIVLSSGVSDPVGIGAKALGTKFRLHHGKDSFPCEVGTDEEYRLHKTLGAHKIVKSVPRRLRDVLRRGGYLNLDQMAKILWDSGGSSWNGNHEDAKHAAEAMEGALELLKSAGCNDVKPFQIRFVNRHLLEPEVTSKNGHDDNSMASKDCTPPVSQLRCWYDSQRKIYFVSDAFLFSESVNAPESKQNSEVDAESVTNVFDETSCREDEAAESKEVKPPIVKNEANAEGTGMGTDNANGSSDKKTDTDLNAESECNESNVEGQELNNTSNGKADDVKKEEITEGKIGGKDVKEENNPDENHHSDIKEAVKQEKNTTEAKKEGHDNSGEESANKEENNKSKNDSEENRGDKSSKYATAKDAAHLLALYIAKEHPDSMMLERFVLSQRR